MGLLPPLQQAVYNGLSPQFTLSVHLFADGRASAAYIPRCRHCLARKTSTAAQKVGQGSGGPKQNAARRLAWTEKEKSNQTQRPSKRYKCEDLHCSQVSRSTMYAETR